MVNYLSYTIIMLAKAEETAITAYKFLYFARPFIYLNLFLLIMDYCGHPIKGRPVEILGSFHTAIAMMAFFMDHNPFFFKSWEFTDSGLFPHLEFEYGPFFYI